MRYQIIEGDTIQGMKTLADNSVDCCITSPPYWGLRDYGHGDQLGLEPTPEAYVENMVKVFREVRRVLKPTGTMWLNLGDTYSAQRWSGNGQGQPMNGYKDGHRDNNFERVSGLPPKNLVGIPWRVALALQADGWYLRQDIIWHKPNPMPESVTDRCTKAHEYLFLMAKSEKYFYDRMAIAEDAIYAEAHAKKATSWGHKKDAAGVKHNLEQYRVTGPGNKTSLTGGKRNKRDVWTITTKPFKGAHFAVMPEALVEPCVLAGCPEGGIVFDPFTGSGTTGAVALRNNRNFIGTELNPEYIQIAHQRIGKEILPLLEVK